MWGCTVDSFGWWPYLLIGQAILKQVGGVTFGLDLFWLLRYVLFCWSCNCCIYGWLQLPTSHERNINSSPTAIGDNYFEHVITGLIVLSLHVGIFYGCMPCFGINILKVHILAVALLIYFPRNTRASMRLWFPQDCVLFYRMYFDPSSWCQLQLWKKNLIIFLAVGFPFWC